MKIERIWAMPNSETFSVKPIKDLLLQEVISGIWLDLFARNSNLSNLTVKVITNDLNPDCSADYHLDALDFLKMYEDNSVDGILYDPPYSLRQVSECYKKCGNTCDNGNHAKQLEKETLGRNSKDIETKRKSYLFWLEQFWCRQNKGF